MSRFLIACGGTGGHLAPGIAVAEELLADDHRVHLLISRKQVDSKLVQKYSHIPVYKAPGRAFQGGLLRYPSALLELLAGLVFAFRVIFKEKPDVVLAFGGFMSIAVVLVARLMDVPVALHEANCRPGRAVRLLARFATRVYLPESVHLPNVPHQRVAHPGYPVRRDVRHSLRSRSRMRLGIEVPGKLLVVIGGSQGASALNEWVVAHFESLAAAGISVYCVTGIGKGTVGTITEVTASGETMTATFTPFTDAMGDVLSAADLVISRAGAGSIAELIRCRVPAILVPYPHAADNHQQANASVHEMRGACVVVEQEHLDRMRKEVEDLIYNDWLLGRFKSNLAQMDRSDPSAAIVADLSSILPRQKQEAIA